jgi:hypothetical protein
MSEPPKPESRSVESSVEKMNQGLDHVSSESVVSTSTVDSKMSGQHKKVGI